MSWLCEFCGYENEYTDEFQPTVCLCCNEEASASVIAKAQKELENLRHEEKRKVQEEKFRQKQQLIKSFVSILEKHFIRNNKIVKGTMMIAIAISGLWCGIAFPSDNVSIKTWSDMAKVNMEHLVVRDFPENLKNNVSVEEIKDIWMRSFRRKREPVTGYLAENISLIKYSFSEQKLENVANAITLLGDKKEDALNIKDNILLNSRGAGNALENLKSNYEMFFNIARYNITKLINKFHLD